MTTLVRWAPFRSRRRRAPHAPDARGLRGRAGLDSRCRRVETEKELIVKLDAPGFDEKEFVLEVWTARLAVKGERSR